METINPNQKLTESWTIEITRAKGYGEHRAHGDVIIAHTSVATSGTGADIDSAKLDLILSIATNHALVDAENVQNPDSGIDKLMLSDEAISRALKNLRSAQRIRTKLKAAAC